MSTASYVKLSQNHPKWRYPTLGEIDEKKSGILGCQFFRQSMDKALNFRRIWDWNTDMIPSGSLLHRY
jgi:hypothetical protein